jgi:hypothetical protein
LTRPEPASPARRILPPRRDNDGYPTSAWLLVQAAQLALETASVLHAINGVDMNLAEELSAQSQVAAMLANAAHAAVIMESRMPLAASWTEGPPRVRAIFARAREAGSDVSSVTPDFTFPPRPPVPHEICSELAQASREDPVPGAQCSGVTQQGRRCTRKVFTGIGSEHCHDHFTPAERRRRDLLQAARARMQSAEEQTADAQRTLQAEWWAERYARLPSRLELPAPPALLGEADLEDGVPARAEMRRLAIHHLYDSGWPDITPRAAEIIRALADLEYASARQIAEHAIAHAPGRWVSAQEWLNSGIWDGYQLPEQHLPYTGAVPEFDENPRVRELRSRTEDDRSKIQWWQDGFHSLADACAQGPVSTMTELLAFWLDIHVLETCDADADGEPRLCFDVVPASPWLALGGATEAEDPQAQGRALRFLTEAGVPQDPVNLPGEEADLLPDPVPRDVHVLPAGPWAEDPADPEPAAAGKRNHRSSATDEQAAAQWLQERLDAWRAPDGTILPPPTLWVPAGGQDGIREQPCANCGAAPGSPCVNSEGDETAEHLERVTLALCAKGEDDLLSLCGGHTKRGRPCSNQPTAGDIYCRTHRDKADRGLPV